MCLTSRPGKDSEYHRTLQKEQGGAAVTADTKTYAGTRKIVLPDSTAELLRCRKKNSYSVWIFPNPIKPEAPMNPSTAYHQLKKLLEENGPPDLRFHDLRHTFATYALANGVDPKTLSGILATPKPASRWTPTPTPQRICTGKPLKSSVVS